jgi:RNA polymerase sigma factor (sigma-70 family)
MGLPGPKASSKAPRCGTSTLWPTTRLVVGQFSSEVALAAVRQAAPIEDPAKIAPWLYRLAIRQVLLYRRKEGRQRKLLDRYAHQLPPDRAGGDPDPLDWLVAEERKLMVRDAVQQLPEKDSEILMLKYREGWSYQQIADHLGVSQSAVEARLNRARHRLRDQLVRSEATGATA